MSTAHEMSLRTALQLAERGIPVFPCKFTTKGPLTENSFYDASTDPNQIRQWWAGHPGALVGVPTGRETDLFVVDVDKKGLQWYSDNSAEFGCGRIHKTRSGGYHLLYRMPDFEVAISTSKFAPGVDIRGDGGYIIWWPAHGLKPARGGLGDIAQAPEWVLARQAETHRTKQRATNVLNGKTPHENGHAADVPAAQPEQKIVATIFSPAQSKITEGSRNDFLFREACNMRGRGYGLTVIDAGVQALNIEHCEPPLEAKEVTIIAGSAAKYEAGTRATDEDAPEAIEPVTLSITPVGVAMLDAPPAEPDVVVEQLMLMDAQGFVAPGGWGKTTLAIFEAVHIILGRPLWGRSIIKPGRVLLATAEDSRAMVVSRLNRIVTALALTQAERECVGDGFFVEDLSTVSARLVATDSKGRIRPTKLFFDIIAGYAGLDLSLVHLDPASLLGPGELTGNDGMAELMRTARRISMATHATCQVVHHVSQSVARGGIQDQYASRGGTAFADNSRGQRQLVRIKERGYEFDGRRYRMPEEITDDHMAEGDVLAILVHKLSYVKLDPRPIFILRRGYSFTQFEAEQTGNVKGHSLNEDMELVAGFIDREAVQGHRHSGSAIVRHFQAIGLTRQRVTDLVREGVENGRFSKVDLPKAECRGERTEYLVTTEGVNEDYSVS